MLGAAPATRGTPGPRRLIDGQGRRFGYLRLSLTKACGMRCLYCRPAFVGQPRGESRLSPAEIEALVRHLATRHGLTKLRLTGGDPSSRRELTEIIERVAGVSGIDDLAMTTNGLTLEHHAAEYARAGLMRVNLSLDSLDPARFRALTGVDGLARVLRGLEAAKAAGLDPIRVNAVVVRGMNEVDLPSLARFAAEQDVEVRFIELMPMGPLRDQWAARYVPEAAMWRALEGTVLDAEPLPRGHGSARRYRVRLDDGRSATLGFITPMSCNFCDACNRLRVAADGALYPCLMDAPTGSLLPALRPALDPERLDALLCAGLHEKRAEHPHDGVAVMTHIGG